MPGYPTLSPWICSCTTPNLIYIMPTAVDFIITLEAMVASYCYY